MKFAHRLNKSIIALVNVHHPVGEGGVVFEFLIRSCFVVEYG